jgi:hypothetical protein
MRRCATLGRSGGGDILAAAGAEEMSFQAGVGVTDLRAGSIVRGETKPTAVDAEGGKMSGFGR